MVVGTELVNELTIGLSEVGRGALRQSEAAQISWAFLLLLKKIGSFFSGPAARMDFPGKAHPRNACVTCAGPVCVCC